MEAFLLSLAAFGSWLLQSSVQASVVIALVLLAQWLFQKGLSPRARYGLWLLVLLRLMLPVLPESPCSIFNYLTDVTVLASQNSSGEAGLLKPTARADTALTPVPSTVPPDTADERKPSSDANAKPVTPALSPSNGGRVTQSGDESGKDWPARMLPRSRITSLHLGLALLWLLGALFLAVRILWFPLRLNQQLARHETVVAPAVFEVLEQSKRTIGIQKVLPIVQSRAVQSPALLGFIRPWLLLPEGMAERFTPQELRFVFLHELAHLKRRDIAVNWLMTILQVLHWFNPFVWFAFSRMRADRELACDELALCFAKAEEHKSYGHAIIKLLEDFSRPTLLPSMVGILEDKQQMKRRIAMIAQFHRPSPWPGLATALAMVLGLVSMTDAQTKRGAEKPSERAANDKSRQKSPGAAKGVQHSLLQPSSSALTLRKMAELPYDLITPEHISSDGRYLLGLSRGPRRGDGPPVLLDLTTGLMRRLEAPALSILRFSPKGERIAIWYREELQLMDLANGRIEQGYRNEQIRSTTAVDWSPDGKSIVAVWCEKEEPGAFACVSITGGKMRELKQFGTNTYAPNCLFSPDGDWIAYDLRYWKENERGGQDIYLLAADGSCDVPLVQHPAEDYLLGWAPHGNRILFASNRRGSWGAYALEVLNGKPHGEPHLLKEGIGKVKPLGFMSNGAFLYLSETRATDVFIAALDRTTGKAQGRPIKMTMTEGKNRYPAWSSDGRYLAYTSPRELSPSDNTPDGLICIHDTQAGTTREIAADAGRVSNPQWAPDGKSLLAISFAAGKRIAYRIDPESGNSVKVAQEVGVIYNTWPLWSWGPDGKIFYQQRTTTNVTSRNIETGERKDIAVPWNRYSTVLSPDAKLFTFSVTTANGATLLRTINIIPVSGGPPRQLLELVGPEAMDLTYLPDEGLGWTPDSKFVLFVKGSSQDPKMRSLWRVPVVGGEPEALGLEMEELKQPVMSPDGRHVAFTAGLNKKEVWVMENFLSKDNTAAK